MINAVQTVRQMQQAASQTKDGRAKALAGMTEALTAYNAYQGVQAGQSVMKDGKNIANTADKMGGINVSVSLGSAVSTRRCNKLVKSFSWCLIV